MLSKAGSTLGVLGSRSSSGGSEPACTNSANMGASLYCEIGVLLEAVVGVAVATAALVASGAGVANGTPPPHATSTLPAPATKDKRKNWRRFTLSLTSFLSFS